MTETKELLTYTMNLPDSIANVEKLLELKPDWDDDGAEPIAQETVDRAIGFLKDQTEAHHKDSPYSGYLGIASARAGSDGGIELKWDRDGCYLVVEFPGLKEKDEPIVYYGLYPVKGLSGTGDAIDLTSQSLLAILENKEKEAWKTPRRDKHLGVEKNND